ncbi:hypothetical protein M3765_16295 [Streptomyces thermoviolaceus]|uniref:hypothetical protein n=1 Tax=Streptomyces thermoviolaceus TaxID=1952 RepID=UPI000F981D71|nr:hypothetical protein [Streptomyces thermoviolaceus]MCM3265560.1 hypothetical protein [Streptomyces thermoviolaceus]RSR95381.1 hypothetical protein EF917_25900 [Streptomyces sp. WAC00469]
MDELTQVTNMFAAMSEAERSQALRAIDGPPRQTRRERPREYIPLPTARGSAKPVVTVRVVRGA